MSDIFASLAAGTLRPTAGGQIAGETAVRVVDASPELARLATGESLRGTVVGRDEHGHLQVQTRLGVLTLALPRPLPVGTEVVLQVRSVGPQVILNLLPLDSAAAGVSPGQGSQAPAGTTAPAPLPVHSGDLVQRGQLLRAVLHAAPPLPSLAGLPTAQPGTELVARILSLGLQPPPAAGMAGVAAPATVGTPVAGPAVPGTPAGSGTLPVPGATPGQAAAAAPAGAPAAQPGPPLPVAAGTVQLMPGLPSAEATAGLRLAPQAPVAASGHNLAAALQGVSFETAAKALGNPAAPAPGGTAAGAESLPVGTGTLRITGLVTSATSKGQPILHTPLGTLTLATGATLPPGTSVALELALPATGAPVSPALAASWPGLESLEEALFHGLPAAQAEAVARALPQVGPRLASGMLFFLAALNQGSIAGWLAQPGGAGRRGEPTELSAGLGDRLGRELASLTRTVDTPAGEWRFVNLPLWSDQGLRELRCFFRHQEHGGQRSGDGDKATRFVLELKLQRHGELQLDGLVRGRLFDLVLRSRRPLPALVRGDLLALFEEANAIAGYSGRLVFQASQDWLQLLAARGAAEHHEGFRV